MSEDDPQRSLRAIATPVLQSLRGAIADGRLQGPLTHLGLSMAGFERPDCLLRVLGGLEPGPLTRLLDAVLAERGTAVAPGPALVWTGPKLATVSARRTGVVVRELLARAESSIFMAGFRVDHEGILEALHSAMVTRDVRVEMVVDVPPSSLIRPASERADAQLAFDRFIHRMWTPGPPRPVFYFDPTTARSAAPGEGVSMHAKCLVIDRQSVLVGSANFTRRAEERNYELGLLAEDPKLAQEIVALWRSLVGAGVLIGKR